VQQFQVSIKISATTDEERYWSLEKLTK